LFFYLSPRLMVEEGQMNKLWSKLSRMVGLSVIIFVILSLGTTPALALRQPQGADLAISISLDSKSTKTGDEVLFDTVVTNNGSQQFPAVIVAMNIINLDKEGDVVDPEDWSPQRTQYLESLAPGESKTLSWTVNTILDGEFMVYVVAIPHPQDAQGPSQIAASPGIHFTVAKFTSLNPSGVLPFALGVPVVLVLAIVVLFRMRRRQIDAGGSS
jgi:hypothetical protein